MFISRIIKNNGKELLSLILLAVFAVPAFLGDGMHLLLPHNGSCCLHLSDCAFSITPENYCGFDSEHHFGTSKKTSTVSNKTSHHEEVHSIDFCPVCSFCSFGKISISGPYFFSNFIPSKTLLVFDQIFCGQKKHLCHQGRSPPLPLVDFI